jgi:hypothetical protein
MLNPKGRAQQKICPWHFKKLTFFCLLFGWLECVGHFFIRKAAIASRLPHDLATHHPYLAIHPRNLNTHPPKPPIPQM